MPQIRRPEEARRGRESALQGAETGRWGQRWAASCRGRQATVYPKMTGFPLEGGATKLLKQSLKGSALNFRSHKEACYKEAIRGFWRYKEILWLLK